MRRLLYGAALGAALALTAAVPTATAAPGARVVRVDTGTDGSQFSAYVYGGPISGDGRYAAFLATDPAPGCQASGFHCGYLKDLRTGELIRIPGTYYYTANILTSADARTVAYSSGNRFTKPYVYDRRTGTTQLLWPADPPDSYELGTAQAVSADGRYVAYTLGNRTPPAYESVLYVRDLVTGADTQVLSPPIAGQLTDVQLSADGRTVAYGLLVPGGFDRVGQVWVRNLDTGETLRADTDAYGGSSLAGLSADGRRVVLDCRSYPDDVVSVRLVDLRTGHVRKLGPDGARAVAADGGARHVLLSDDDTQALSLLDVHTGRSRPVASGALAVTGAVSRDGREVEFLSGASDLVPDDTNGVNDVFVRFLRP
ncbi:hypothetical protein EDD90_3521 [Streptomyces sp. Ag109_O5-1]|uniref:WD40 repeat domain-containing protein n=1 Tax=Streptomyces sp. Ag109_O5-1 TaxID=1938851 RepID=UPI000F4F6513|nr:hypothetical protein [Streptomyces sp. Ag109_O5-1]RPE40469.1 hypothetical protein EDD90_3521 [Streptomyces sp. Ag109_O5-1]